MKIIENVTDCTLKKQFLEKFFNRNPEFFCDKFETAYDTLLPDIILKKWEISDQHFALIFVSQPATAYLNAEDDFYRKGSLPRFMKSLLLEWESGEIVSLGLPMMASVSDRPSFLDYIKSAPSPDYVEKLDGVCLLATKYRDGILVKSRRSIYHYGESLDSLLCLDSLDVGASIQKLLVGEWDNLGPFTVAFECVFPHPYFYKCGNPQFAALLGSSPHFTPYVAYHKEGVALTCIIKHSGELLLQKEVDRLAKKYGLPRANTSPFSSVSAAQAFLKAGANHEGYIVHIDEGQTPVKWKTDWYRQVMRVSSAYHRLKKETRQSDNPATGNLAVVDSNIEGL
jgi:hypothetical protein